MHKLKRFMWLLLAAIITCNCNSSDSENGDDLLPSLTDEEICAEEGGTWVQFLDGCGDSCANQREEGISCTTSITYGCECGEDQCWNGSSCEPVTEDEETLCLNGGGSWELLPSGCGDSCESQRDATVMCTTSFQYNCACDGNQCWNGESCETL